MFEDFHKNADLEKVIAKNEKKIKDLEILESNFNRQYQQLFLELNMKPEELSEYINNPTNFSSEEWEAIQNKKKHYARSLKRDLSSIDDPSKTKKKYASRKIGQNWIYVK
jgi:hypothetical protein